MPNNQSLQANLESQAHSLTGRGPSLEPCSTCGNLYDKSFRLEHQGKSYTFDCFECAIQSVAPSCTHCGVRVIGHGVESQGEFFCGAHCARERGVIGTQDRADNHPGGAAHAVAD